MKDLIAKLESATGPDTELDLRLHMARNPDSAILFNAGRSNAIWGCYRDVVIEDWPDQSELIRIVRPPRYTSSIDAALTLVPEGAEKELSDLYGEAKAAVGLNFHDGPLYGRHKGGSLAIALCIAALKAREASHG